MSNQMVTKLQLHFKKNGASNAVKVVTYSNVNELAEDADIKAVSDAMAKVFAYPLVEAVRQNAIKLEA